MIKGERVKYFNEKDGVTREFICIEPSNDDEYAELRCLHCFYPKRSYKEDHSINPLCYDLDHDGVDEFTFRNHIC